MTEALVYAGEAVECAIVAEENSQETESFVKSLPKLEKGSGSMYGIQMMPEQRDLLDKARNREGRRALIKKYRDDANAIRCTLVAAGITPIAVITQSAWHKILTDLDLFVLWPDKNGCVAVNDEIVNELRATSSWVHKLAVPAGFLTTFAAFFSSAWLLSNLSLDPVSAFIPCVGAALIAGGISYAFLDSLGSKHQARKFNERVRAWLASKTWTQVLKALSHRYRGSVLGPHTLSAPNWGGHKITLPPAPSEIIDMVMRFSKIGNAKGDRGPMLSIAAEADAIKFADGIEKVFEVERLNQERREWEAKHDPILFWERGSAVAILGQYGGEFKLERAAIDAVVNSEHLL